MAQSSHDDCYFFHCFFFVGHQKQIKIHLNIKKNEVTENRGRERRKRERKKKQKRRQLVKNDFFKVPL